MILSKISHCHHHCFSSLSSNTLFLATFVRESAIQKAEILVAHQSSERCRWWLKTSLPAALQKNTTRRLLSTASWISCPHRVYARWLQKWIGDFLNVESPFLRVDVESAAALAVSDRRRSMEERTSYVSATNTVSQEYGHWPVYKNPSTDPPCHNKTIKVS